VRKRIENDIWQNLYEFILVETAKPFTVQKLEASDTFKSTLPNKDYTIKSVSQVYKQQLTHQTINGQFINIILKKPLSSIKYDLVAPEKIKELAFPKFITTYLKD
jgi:A/G-specific adenine glycosylase